MYPAVRLYILPVVIRQANTVKCIMIQDIRMPFGKTRRITIGGLNWVDFNLPSESVQKRLAGPGSTIVKYIPTDFPLQRDVIPPNSMLDSGKLLCSKAGDSKSRCKNFAKLMNENIHGGLACRWGYAITKEQAEAMQQLAGAIGGIASGGLSLSEGTPGQVASGASPIDVKSPGVKKVKVSMGGGGGAQAQAAAGTGKIVELIGKYSATVGEKIPRCVVYSLDDAQSIDDIFSFDLYPPPVEAKPPSQSPSQSPASQQTQAATQPAPSQQTITEFMRAIPGMLEAGQQVAGQVKQIASTFKGTSSEPAVATSSVLRSFRSR
jgi:hypothetical protein